MSRFADFISDIDVLLGKSLFYSQSRISQIVKDEIFAILRFRDFTFQPTVGHYQINERFLKDLTTLSEMLQSAGSRGNSSANYSVSQTFNSIPLFAHEIIGTHRCSIEGYLGRGFLYEPPQIWRNSHLPVELENYDVYSNVWHQDSHDGSRLIKLFVQLQTVTKEDGPLTYLERAATRYHWKKLRHRWDFSKLRKVPRFEEERHFTGNPGAYLLVDTSRIMHKAGNPKNIRDIFQITLYPRWRSGVGRFRYDN